VKTFSTPAENTVKAALAEAFEQSRDATEIKLACFPKYVRRHDLKKFLSKYEIFKLALPLKGSIVECGVFRGSSLMSWAKLSTILEPENLNRRIYGFDTFAGFPSLDAKDKSARTEAEVGDLDGGAYEELGALIQLYNQDRFLGHIPKVQLIKGDLQATVPQFIAENPHLLVSLLFLDCDLYEPTKAALKHFLPRMPKGALLVFDELDNPHWPGETLALLEEMGVSQLRLRRLEWDPYTSYAFIE
jgi:hypothetical protein